MRQLGSPPILSSILYSELLMKTPRSAWHVHQDHSYVTLVAILFRFKYRRRPSPTDEPLGPHHGEGRRRSGGTVTAPQETATPPEVGPVAAPPLAVTTAMEEDADPAVIAPSEVVASMVEGEDSSVGSGRLPAVLARGGQAAGGGQRAAGQGRLGGAVGDVEDRDRPGARRARC